MANLRSFRRVQKLGGIKGLASGPDDSLYAVTPGAVLKVKLDARSHREATNRGTGLRSRCATEYTCGPRTIPDRTDGEFAGRHLCCGHGLSLRAQTRPEGRASTILKAEAPWSPTGVVLYGEDLYVAEWTNAHSEQHDFRPRVRKVARDGKVITVGMIVTAEGPK